MKKFIPIILLILIFAIYSCSIRDEKKEFISESPEISKRIRDTIMLSKSLISDAEWIEIITDNKNLNKVQVHGDESKVKICDRYIGRIKTQTNTFHAVSRYKTIQAALSKHGQSRLILINKEKSIIKRFETDQVHALPIKIENGLLIFHHNGELKCYEPLDERFLMVCPCLEQDNESLSCMDRIN